jgi:uncharacterized membrane protein YbhN (UPF0104 family)
VKPRTKRILQAIASAVLVVGIFAFALPQVADYGEVWSEIEAMTWIEISTLGLVALWNLVTYWFVLTAVLPGLSYPQAAVANQASTAVANSLPGGAAIAVGVTYAMYRSWGFGKSEFALAAVVSGVWNNFVKLGMPVVALALLALTGGADARRVTAAAAGIGALVASVAVGALFLYSQSFASKLGAFLGRYIGRFRRWLRRPPLQDWGAAAVRFRAQALSLLQKRWLRLTVATLVSHISLYLVLLITLRHVGVGQGALGWIEVLAVFAFVRLISALPLTPGGVGVVELGLTVGLQLAESGDLFDDKIAAAVLVFRAITFVLPVPLGALAYVFWRRNQSWRRSASHEETVEQGPDREAKAGTTGDVEWEVGTHIDT